MANSYAVELTGLRLVRARMVIEADSEDDARREAIEDSRYSADWNDDGDASISEIEVDEIRPIEESEEDPEEDDEQA